MVVIEQSLKRGKMNIVKELQKQEIKVTYEDVERKIRNYFDKDEIHYLLASLIAGLMAHLYACVNNINNFDSIRQLWYGDGITSGRWFLQILGDVTEVIWGIWDVGFFNRIITLLLIVIAAGMIPKIYGFHNKLLGILSCVIFVVYPTVTSMMFYSHTSVYYAIAVIMSLFSVYSIEKKYIGGIISSILITYATGIYQASFTFVATLMLIRLIMSVINNKNIPFGNTMKKAVKYFIVLVVGLCNYFVMTKITVYIYGEELSSYQGINTFGMKNINDIPRIVADTWKGFFRELLWGMNSEYGIALTGVMRLSSLVLLIISLLIVLFVLCDKGTMLNKMLLTILLILWPFTVNSINFASYGNRIYTLMVYSFYGVFLLSMLLLDYFLQCNDSKSIKINILKKGLKITEIIIYFVVSSNYVYQSNGNYEVMSYMDQKTVNKIMLIMSQVYNLEGYTPDMDIVFVNSYSNDQCADPFWYDSPFKYGGQWNLINCYTISCFPETYIGINPRIKSIYNVDMEGFLKIDGYNEDEYIKKMPLYPADGSIQIYNGEVIVKFDPDYIPYE